MRIYLALILFSTASIFSEENNALIANEVVVKLQNPTYQEGVLFTNEGGVIENKDIRIQAKSIQYIRKKNIHSIQAEGELLVQYKKRVFVGSELTYDFISKTGVVYDAKTSVEALYLGAEKITINPDESFEASEAFMTDCENKDAAWNLHAKKIIVSKKGMIKAQNTSFRLYRIPIFWLPEWNINKKTFSDPLIDYDLKWDSKMGPKASIRCQLYSQENLALYGRLDYRMGVGWGGSFETEYLPKEHKTRFVTRSYLGKDRLESAPNPARRYRLLGDFIHSSENERSLALVSWDKYSDVRMQSDFKIDDFATDRAQKTIAFFRQRGNRYIASLKLRPRANPFESIKQDLPTIFLATPPLLIGNSGIYSSTVLQASYLDFSYSSQLISPLPNYRSTRLELNEKLYRPLQVGPVMFTPFAGGNGIFYGNSPDATAKWFGILSYGMKAEGRGVKHFTHFKHQILPYLECSSFTKPTASPDQHYIFSIQDGFDQLNQVKAGIKNILFAKNRPGKDPTFTADVYLNGFFANQTIPQFIPYGYINLGWSLPSVFLEWKTSWNFRENVLQYSNARLKWTVNEHVALSLEGRYRSKYDWRKSDHENYILDVTRDQSELLLSSLSDRRVTLLTNLFIRLNPFWECTFQSHHGFFRVDQAPYNELMCDLLTWINRSLKLRMSYRYTDYTKPNFPHHFNIGLELVK